MASPWGRLSTEGDHFLCNGEPWKWRGITAFRALEMFLRGDPGLATWLDVAQGMGANLIRTISMKANNTGWELRPPYAADDLVRFYEAMRARKLFVEMTVFADTKALMPDEHAQQSWWNMQWNVASQFEHVVCELINEAGHTTQQCDPQRFSKPAWPLCSHGSGQTDEDVVRPTWDYAAYHSRRPNYWNDPVLGNDGRGISGYSPFAYQEYWPKECPFISDEGPKPASYGYDIGYARRMGEHAGCIAGGTFHVGINGDPLTPEEVACGREFYFGITRGWF